MKCDMCNIKIVEGNIGFVSVKQGCKVFQCKHCRHLKHPRPSRKKSSWKLLNRLTGK